MKTIAMALSFVLLGTVSLPAIAAAHGTAGLTLTGSVDGYTGDVDYDYLLIEAGVPGRFVFNLFTGDAIDVPGTGVDFDDLWVRIEQKKETGNGKTIFAGPIAKQQFGGAGMIMTLPEPGEYTFLVRYTKDDEKIVEISYPFTVYSVIEEEPFKLSLQFFGGLVAGLITYGLFTWLYRWTLKKQVVKVTEHKEEGRA